MSLSVSNVHVQVRGLCGTLTWTPHDDFTTPDGDVENNVPSFAKKFAGEGCALPGGAPPDACTTFAQRRQHAEAVCAVMHAAAFQVAHVPLAVLWESASPRPLPSVAAGLSRRGGEGALLPPVPVGGVCLCPRGGVSLHGPHGLRPALRSGGRRRALAEPDLLP